LVTKITEEFIMGSDVWHTCVIAMDLGWHMLFLGEEEVPLGHGCEHLPSLRANTDVVPAYWGVIMAAVLISTLEAVKTVH
jgi:hypothetical protein